VAVLSDAMWRDYDVSYEGEKQTDGGKQHVLSLKHKWSEGTQRLWIDANTLQLLKREKYDHGRMEKRFEYKGAKKIEGIWVPSRLEAYSPTGKLAGVTEYRDIRVNAGISDSEFH